MYTVHAGDEAKRKPRKKRAIKPFKITGTPPLCTLYNPIAWILIAFDVVLIILTCKWTGMCRRRSPKVAQVSKEGTHRRQAAGTGALIETPYKGCDTVYKLFVRSVGVFGSKRCFGTRKFLGTHKVPGARFPLKLFGATGWRTYAQAAERVSAFGAGLVKLGMVALPKDEGAEGGADFESLTGQWTPSLLHTSIRVYIHTYI